MLKAIWRTPPRVPALAGVLTIMLLVLGCAAEPEKPTVVEDKPSEPKVATLPPAAPAEPEPMPSDAPDFWQTIPELGVFHGYEAGIRWRLASSGIQLEDAVIEGHAADIGVVRRVWGTYGEIIKKWSEHYDVPIEVVLTAVCVESKGNPRAKGGRNIGLMQLLVPTAQAVLDDPTLTEEALYDPDTNIHAGTAYIARQSGTTRYDPPKVAAAYNAGSLRSDDNRWGMKQYGPHLDKTVVWFNTALAFLANEGDIPQMSFAKYFAMRQ